MDKAIVTILLTIAGIVAAGLAIAAINPTIQQTNSSLVMAADKMNNRVQSQIEIIHAAGELDSSGNWQDSDSDGYFDVFIWVKNVGSARILDEKESDLFLGKAGSISRIPNYTYATATYPRWTSSYETGSEWGQTNTLKVTVHYNSTQTQGTYYIKFLIPNGISDEYTFSM